MSILDELSGPADVDSYEKRLQHLRTKKVNPFSDSDVGKIDTGIDGVVSQLNQGHNSFVIYGEPQSGKTEVMIAITCKLLDLGYETIFILMNDNIDLEGQNFDRFCRCQELPITPIRDTKFIELEDRQRKPGSQRLIFCRKNSPNLEKLIVATRWLGSRILIDDEADYATPDRNINKVNEERTRINERVGNLLKGSTDSVYIGVTATPARLDLNNTFFNDWKNWVFLTPYDDYKGRRFFFPSTEDEKNKSDYQLRKLPDDGDNPRHLTDAILRFLARVAFLNLEAKGAGQDISNYSMLIHTAGIKNDHLKDEKTVRHFLFQLSSDEEDKASRERLWTRAQTIVNESIDLSKSAVSSITILKDMYDNIRKTDVVVINSDNDRINFERALNPQALFTFAIGGNIVSRGLTFNNLLTFFFSRTVKGKMQQNTYIQRARMFGNRPYSKHFELCVPKQLFETWASCFEQHELSLISAKAGNYVHIQSKSTSAADRASIDERYVLDEGSGERAVGSTFNYSTEIDRRLTSRGKDPLSIIRGLQKEGLIPQDAFDSPIMGYIEQRSAGRSSVLMVLRQESKPVVQTIERYKDGDIHTLMRARRGTIQAITKGQDHGRVRHFICPIRSETTGRARFLYLGNLGEQILINKLRVKR